MENITENTTETMEKKISEDAGGKKKDSPKGRGPWIWLLIILWGAAIVCLVIFAIGKYREYKAEKKYEMLAAQTELTVDEETPKAILEQIADEIETETPEPTPEPTPDPMQVLEDLGVPIPDKTVDFETLQEETNPDIYAWIYIPNTNIDYPVLQHPTDNGFYLSHNLDGSAGYPGCIYSENYNSKDWTDPVTVLYGHNMRAAGTMFNQLHKFEKEDFFDENQYVYIYTPEKLLVYQVFATEIHMDEHLLMNHDFTDKEHFQKFFNVVQNSIGESKFVREGVEITEDSKILVLSTCMADKNRTTERYLVYTVLLNE